MKAKGRNTLSRDMLHVFIQKQKAKSLKQELCVACSRICLLSAYCWLSWLGFLQRISKIQHVMLYPFFVVGWLELLKLFFVSLPGCEAEVPLGSGWGHGEAGRTGEEDRQGCGRVQALLGGTQAGQTGQSTVLGGKGKQVLSLFGHVHFRCYVEHHVHFVLKNQEMTRDLSCTRSKLLYSL